MSNVLHQCTACKKWVQETEYNHDLQCCNICVSPMYETQFGTPTPAENEGIELVIDVDALLNFGLNMLSRHLIERSSGKRKKKKNRPRKLGGPR